MSFHSYSFILLFLPLCIIALRLTASLRPESLGAVLIAFSLVFVASQSLLAVVLFAGLILINYGFGLALSAPGDTRHSWRRRILLLFALICNLLPLVALRLGISLDFFTWERGDGFTLITGAYCGLAFWTLIQIAWLVSIYRQHIEPEGLYRHATFSLAFPYLLSGPIVRYEQLGVQYDHLGLASNRSVAIGIGVFIIGLAKKVLLADALGQRADIILAAATNASMPPTLALAWIAVFCVSLEIYFDFSGYTDMAVGIGYMLGLRLPENFHSPYRAASFIEFWRRWHITFSTWLHDFVYMPLAGMHPTLWRILLGIVLALLFAGLWHGSGVCFLLWAGVHLFFLAIACLFRVFRGPFVEMIFAALPVRVVCVALTFTLVSLSWMWLRLDSLEQVIHFYSMLIPFDWFGKTGLVQAGLTLASTGQDIVLLLVGLLLVFCFPTTHAIFLGYSNGTKAWLSFRMNGAWALFLAALLALSLGFLTQTKPFIFG